MTLFSFKPAISDGGSHGREDKSRERMFLEHYSWLRECALNITRGERERAEDLVHDVFLQFLDKDVEISRVADIRGYLNGILRNLHLLQLRRLTRRPVQQLSLLDHDSAQVGLRSSASSDQLLSADSLVRACDFACHRKESSLAIGVLILRYFHGYYPGEICQLLDTRRRLVYRWIERGRSETKEYMDSPYPLPDRGSERKTAPPVSSPQAFLCQLRDRIFASCTTACEVLSDPAKELGISELAHLVSCRECLDERSRATGLRYVSERLADDIADNDDGRPQGGSGGSGEDRSLRVGRKQFKRALLREVYARRRERFEHRPKEITLAFDGQPRATLLVNAPTNTLQLSLDAKEVPSSIAVLSEQEFHLLVLNHEELTAGERRLHRLSLSDNRFLEVSVTPETLGLSIQVVYEDPFFLTLSGTVDDHELQTIPAETPVFSFPSSRIEPWSAVCRSGQGSLLDPLRNLFAGMNPLLTTAIVSGVVAVLCFVFWLRSAPSLSAGQVLDRAQKSEHLTAANRPGVIFERVAIRSQRKTLERTIYRDAQGIRHPRRQQLSPEDEQLKNSLENAGVKWDAPLSADDYAAWRTRSGETRDAVTRSGQHLLTLTTTPLAEGAVVRETLTVRDTDFHPVDRTVELRDSGTVEIAELNYDLLPWGVVNQDWFEPLAGAAVSDVPGMRAAIHLPRVLSDLELDEAELGARFALNQLHADAGERIRLTRTPSGIEIKGVVDTNARKQEIASHLDLLPNVHSSILSVEEIETRPLSQSEGEAGEPIQVYSVEAEPSPLEQYLREQNLNVDQLAAVSHNILNSGLKVGQAEGYLSELQPRLQEAGQLPRESQNQLSALFRSYLATIEVALDANKRTLGSLGLEDANDAGASPEINPNEEDIGKQTRRYQELCQALVTSRASQSQSAEAIAKELMDADERIRLYLATLSRTVPGHQD